MREKLTELEALGDKVAASHEEEINLIRREEETKRAELEEELKRKFRNESQQRAQSYLQETEEVMEGAKKKYEDRFQANKEKWQVLIVTLFYYSVNENVKMIIGLFVNRLSRIS